jgi:dienelactone hydrolase
MRLLRNVLPILLVVNLAACDSTPAPVPGPAAPAAPNIQTREVSYSQNGTTLKGLMAWDANAAGKRPGILVVHEWWGHDEHARNQARRAAEAGYVALAVDMYGDGKQAAHPADAQKFMTEATRDPAVVAARFNAARDVLMKDPNVNPDQIAAIGYCFGGAVVLGMARTGADLDAAVSFHGALETPAAAKPGAVKARVLVLHGEADPMVTPAHVEAFRKEMTDAGANFRIVTYPGAKHAFTNPKAESHGMDALAYNEEADRKSWKEMLDLLKDTWR